MDMLGIRQAKRMLARHKGSALVLAAVAGAVYWTARGGSKRSKAAEARLAAPVGAVQAPRKRKVAVDAVFLTRLARLAKVIFPPGWHREHSLVALLMALLLVRTGISITIADFTGYNAECLVKRDKPAFIMGVARLALLAVPASLVNSSLRYITSVLSVCFRRRLVLHVHEQYLQGHSLFKAGADSQLTNADQRVTQDVEKFASAVSQLIASIFKPTVDMVVFAHKVAQNGGVVGPLSMISYFLASGVFLRTIMPNFGRMTARTQELEGGFRYSHSRIITHAEEISFYNGSERERALLNERFAGIMDHSTRLFSKKAVTGVVEDYLVKYGATIIGYTIVARPVFLQAARLGAEATKRSDGANITNHYIRSTQLLMNLAKAIGQIVGLYKSVTALAGYTARVAELMELLKTLNSRTVAEQGEGTVIMGDKIQFIDADIVTPDNRVLCHDLNFTVEPGANLLITGPNGCGKSSLFRILGELWPLSRGTIIKPEPRELFYIPQRPYLVLGTLRDQVIYPHSQEEMTAAGRTDADLQQCLEWANLDDLVGRCSDGWDTVHDWTAFLSGGQKQRMAMARLFYHRPKFAILDECTSAVSMDTEGKMYTQCQILGIALVTVSHRKTLWKFHENLLLFDGEGNYEYKPVPKDELGYEPEVHG